MSDLTTRRPDHPYRQLNEFVDLGRSSVISHYRSHLAATNVSRSAPVFTKLQSFLNFEFVLRAWKFARVFFSFRHRFQDYNYAKGETGVFPLACSPEAVAAENEKEIRLSLAGDWGTGTQEAEAVAEQMLDCSPHYSVHLGDVYYVGDRSEVEEHCLNVQIPGNHFTPVKWPHGTVGSFALNGNHEMYSNGTAYFCLFLPTLGIGRPNAEITKHQSASFFCLRNSHWMIIGLDTGYNSVGWASVVSLCKLEKQLMNWLSDRVEPQKFSGSIVLLGHHQYFSRFEHGYSRPATQLSGVLDKRTVLWFWGHEHRMAIYGKYKTGRGITAFGRCVGHGGMPVSLSEPDPKYKAPLVLYDKRVYAELDGTRVGFNGYVNLKFAGSKLEVEYFTIKDASARMEHTLVASEAWESRSGEPFGAGIKITPGGLTRAVEDISAAQR